MKFAAIKPNELAIVKNETLIPIGELLPKGSTMIDLITAYDGIKGKLDALAAGGTGVGLDAKLLKPPVENPSKIWAAAGNYKRGTGGIGRCSRARNRLQNLARGIARKYFSETAISDRRARR